VPIDTPADAESSGNGFSRPQQSRSAIPPRPLLSSVVLGADVFSPSFAPHGELLFHSGRKHSALMRATFDWAGTPAVATLLRDGATNYHATLSPDGMWLSYDSDRDGTRGVYVARSDASEPRKISGDGYAAVPRWSPDGRHLAFLKAEDRRPRVWNVWVADLTTGSTSRVSGHDVGQTWGASWFPDGQRFAYSVEDKLVLAHVNNASFRVIPSPRRGHLIRTPAVSPDGNYVVFQVHRDGGWLLDVARGTVRRVLTDVTAEEFAWSPDGHRVVFHTRRNGAWSVWQLELEPKMVAGAV
jgi:Tol biopolymer transport system component